MEGEVSIIHQGKYQRNSPTLVGQRPEGAEVWDWLVKSTDAHPGVEFATVILSEHDHSVSLVNIEADLQVPRLLWQPGLSISDMCPLQHRGMLKDCGWGVCQAGTQQRSDRLVPQVLGGCGSGSPQQLFVLLPPGAALHLGIRLYILQLVSPELLLLLAPGLSICLLLCDIGLEQLWG